MINSVLGPIPSVEMGITLAHEHVACFSHSMKQTFGERWFETEELILGAAKLLTKAREQYGIQTIIDGTPNDLGRDADILRRVSTLSGVNIVVSSGMYYCEEPFLENKSPEFFAEFFTQECNQGIAGTKILPGALKCATGIRGFTPFNVMLLKTMAIVQKQTGLALFAHNTHSIKSASDQINILEEQGADLSRVIVGHCSDTNDIDYLESLLKRGCYLGFDRLRPNADSNLDQAKTLCTLIERGWIDQLLLSHDYCVFIDFRNNSWEQTKAQGFDDLACDYTYIHRSFLPALRLLGITEVQIKQMLIANSARIFNI